MATSHLLLSLLLLLSFLSSPATSLPTSICVIGSGIAGSSLTFFLQNQTAIPTANLSIRVFERRGQVGGRTAPINISGDLFNAGASIIHGQNLHAVWFAELLGLDRADPEGTDWLGIWDGSGFVFKTLKPPPESSSATYKWWYDIADALLLLKRYGFSLYRMQRFVTKLLEKFILFYKEPEERPIFETVEEMLKWNDLYALTQRTLEQELIDAGLSARLISELVTVITRISYGQSVAMSGLAGAVALAGSNSDLWSVKGGNYLLAKGLLELTNPTLHLHEGIESISDKGDHYVLASDKGKEYECDVTVIATPLDEVNITFVPPVLLPSRRMQHTYTTFIRGLLNPKYFGLSSVEDIPDLVGTLETPDVPFSSVSILKKYGEGDFTYKIFSRAELHDSLLDQLFSVRKEMVRIDWPAYPHYTTRIQTFSMSQKMAFSMELPLEKVLKWLFPRATLGKTTVANTLLGNSQYFQGRRWKCSFLAFSMRLPLEKERMEILSNLATVWSISKGSILGPTLVFPRNSQEGPTRAFPRGGDVGPTLTFPRVKPLGPT